MNDELLEDDQQQNEQGGPTIGGSSAPAAQAKTPPQQTPGKKTPGNFANLSEYLRVNAPQQFGQQVAGKIGDEISQGEQTIGDADKQFKERVDSNTVRDTQGLTQQLSTNPQGINADAFAKVRDASYNGPKSLADTQDLSSRVQGAVGTATGKAAASGTESGRFALLDSYFGKPQYSQGQKSLDNLLIQNDPNSQQAFGEIQNRATALQGQAKNLGGNLQQYGGMGAATTADTRSGARSALGIDDAGQATGTGALGDAHGAVDSRFAAEKKRLGNELSTAQGLAGQGSNRFNLSPEFMQAMGLSNTAGYGVDPSQFLRANSITKEQAATADQAQRLRALESLGGQQSYLGEQGIGTSGATKGYSFDSGRYQNTVGIQQKQYQNDAAAADQAIKAAQAEVDRANNAQLDIGGGNEAKAAAAAALEQANYQRALVDNKYLGNPAGSGRPVNPDWRFG